MNRTATHTIDQLSEGGEPHTGIHSRTLYRGDGATVVLFTFAEGEELSEHTSSKPAMVHLLSGRMRMTFAGEEIDAAPGTWVQMEPGTEHAMTALTPARMLLTLLVRCDD